MKKKVYLAGPMSGLPWFNFPAFHKAAYELRDKGYEVFSPAEKDIELFGTYIAQIQTGTHAEIAVAAIENNSREPTYKECLRNDLLYILDEAEAIALLPGWEKSSGAKVEKALADCLKLELIEL